MSKTFEQLRAERLSELTSTPEYVASMRRGKRRGATILGVLSLLLAIPCLTLGWLVGPPVALAVVGCAAGLGWLVGAQMTRAGTGMQAREWARGQAMQDWAGAHGLAWSEQAQQSPGASFLPEGDRFEVGAGFSGQLVEGIGGWVFNYVWYTREERTETDMDGDSKTVVCWKPHPMVVLRLDLGLPLERVTVHPRALGGIGRMFDGAVSATTGGRVVELESEEFSRSFQLTVDDRDDDVMVHRVFDPEMIMQFVDLEAKLPELTVTRDASIFTIPGHVFDATDANGLAELDGLFATVSPIVRQFAHVAARMARGEAAA